MNSRTSRLPKDFYLRDTIDVAHDLLGCTLVHETRHGRTTGIITETEAYLGAEDPACHTFAARQTERVKSMYLDGGHAYVYLIYGMHWCFNVVTMNVNEPEAVLIRAVQPSNGVDLMIRRRNPASKSLNHKQIAQLTNGAGKLCEAFGITKECDSLDLTVSKLYIQPRTEAVSDEMIFSSERVGIASAGDAAHWPLRFRIALDTQNAPVPFATHTQK